MRSFTVEESLIPYLLLPGVATNEIVLTASPRGPLRPTAWAELSLGGFASRGARLCDISGAGNRNHREGHLNAYCY